MHFIIQNIYEVQFENAYILYYSKTTESLRKYQDYGLESLIMFQNGSGNVNRQVKKRLKHSVKPS